MSSPVFLGEIELCTNEGLDVEAGTHERVDFERLPQAARLRSLAREFQGRLEIMPYRRLGEDVKMLLSVYLDDARSGGTIIAVLCRVDYPRTARELADTVEAAMRRLSVLPRRFDDLDSDSVASARRAVDALRRRLEAEIDA